MQFCLFKRITWQTSCGSCFAQPCLVIPMFWKQNMAVMWCVDHTILAFKPSDSLVIAGPFEELLCFAWHGLVLGCAIAASSFISDCFSLFGLFVQLCSQIIISKKIVSYWITDRKWLWYGQNGPIHPTIKNFVITHRWFNTLRE